MAQNSVSAIDNKHNISHNKMAPNNRTPMLL